MKFFSCVTILIVGMFMSHTGFAVVEPVQNSLVGASTFTTTDVGNSGVVIGTTETSTGSSTDRCTVNGRQVDCGNLGKSIVGLGVGILVFIGLIILLGILVAIFWLFMLAHVIMKPVENKILWIVLLFVFSLPAAIVYYFMVKREFDKPKLTATITAV